MELPVKQPVCVGGSVSSSYTIEAKKVSYSFHSLYADTSFSSCWRSRNRCPRYILKDVYCEARSGEMTAIAGPSGAGKTTLLEILGGKTAPSKISGQLLINGAPADAKSVRKLSGFVTQDDALFPLLTVEETLMYSALLRLPGGKKEAGTRVAVLMRELGLDHVAGSRIGEGSNNGISGGERRRVSIGVELVHNPAVVLIDEPTSGLDSASALHVVSLLKAMVVEQGKTILLTIHQPGFRILELLDRLLLLSNGFVLHNGSLRLLEDRLKFVGHFIPPHINVLEFAIDVSSSLVIQTPHNLSNQILLNNQQHIQESEHDYDMSSFFHANRAEDHKSVASPNSHLDEILILGDRFYKNIFRTKQLFFTRIIQALLTGVILGTIFINVATDQGNLALQARIGFFAFSLTFLLSSTTEGLPIFLQERRIFMRETSRGAYRVSSYVISNTLIFIPFLLMIALLYTIPVYWLVGLRQNVDGFLYFSLVVWMVILMSNSFTACFSALVPNFIMGTSVLSGLMGSFFLFSGYFISKENIPSYWIFMHYMSLFKYPYECFMINQYGGNGGRTKCIQSEGGKCKMYGDGFLKQQGLRESQKWSNLGVMLGFIIGYRLLCFLILWFRCYRTRN